MDIGRRIGLQLVRGADFADCTFLVQGHTIEAHRVILAAASAVFETMLTPPWGRQGLQVQIDDISYEDFMDVLYYCYSDCVTFRSIEHAGDLLYAFNKYMVVQASAKCRSYLKMNIRINTAHKIYQICDELNEVELGDEAFKHICQYAGIILNEHIDEVDGELLRKIAGSNQLNMSDAHLIEFAWKWARIVIRRKKMSLKKKYNVRKVLAAHGVLGLIRFLALTPQEYQYCQQYLRAMLYYREMKFLQSYMHTNRTHELSPDAIAYNLNYEKVPRLIISINLISIQRMIVYPMRFLSVNRNTVLSVGLRSDCTILLRGFIIPCRSIDARSMHWVNPNYDEHILFTIQQQNDPNEESHMGCIRHKVPHDAFQSVILEQPILIKHHEWYDFEFTWPSLNATVLYKADSCIIHTKAGAHIEFRDTFDDRPCRMYFGYSFLKGIKYSI